MAKYTRLLELRRGHPETFFLWGPRQAGKSTLLAETFPDVPWVDLLRPESYRRYLQAPQLLIDEQRRHGADFIVIDEIQKVPALLDAVHWLIERRGVHFALCGSSARKVRRGAANLLGGRGERRELYGLSAREIGPGVDLERLLNHGYLPSIHDAPAALPRLDAYVSQYLKEEVAAEGLSRRLPAYCRTSSSSRPAKAFHKMPTRRFQLSPTPPAAGWYLAFETPVVPWTWLAWWKWTRCRTTF